ncbi:MAG: hypothetical protein U0703_21695 [Anaerolineae bacterium]
MQFIRKIRFKWLIHAGILLTFALIPVWYRLPQSPLLARLYVTRFLIFLPMLWAIFWWLVLRAPGLRDLHGWRARWALALLLLALWGFASQVWAFQRVDYPDVGATAALQFGVSALFAVVVACAAPSPRAIVAVLVLALIGNSALTILQAQHQASLGLLALGEFPFNPQIGVSILESGTLRWVRPTACSRTRTCWRARCWSACWRPPPGISTRRWRQGRRDRRRRRRLLGAAAVVLAGGGAAGRRALAMLCSCARISGASIRASAPPSRSSCGVGRGRVRRRLPAAAGSARG